MTNFVINTLCIIGVGSIGGSVACALRKTGCVNKVIGVGRHEANLKRAVELGVIDDYSSSIKTAVTNADLIIVLKDGSLLDSGTHEDLILRNIDYRRLFERFSELPPMLVMEGD